MARIHGAASASEAVSGNLNFYTMYITEKVNAVPGVDITATGNILDQTQQNLDDIVNIISLVAQPIIMNNPVAVSLTGIAPTLTGNGYVFKFAVEHGGVFERGGDNVSILKEIFFGTTIDGVALEPANVEFVMSDIL
jgi:hypothetical protein